MVDTKLVGGLIALVFLTIGPVLFYPYYVVTDNCIGGSWENVTETYFYNSTFPAIGRYYCEPEAELTIPECLELNKLLNEKGCKWGGKTSKRNSAGNQYRLYVMVDPELPKEKPEVTYTDDSMTTELGGGRFNSVIDSGGYYNESGVIKIRSEVSNLLEATTAGTNKRVWSCDIIEDNDTGVKCNSVNVTNGKWLVDLEVNTKEIGDYPIKVESYNYTSEKIEIKEVDTVSLLSLSSTPTLKVELNSIYDIIHIGESSTVVNIHGNNSDVRFKDNLIYVSDPARNYGTAALLEINAPATSHGIFQIGGLSDYLGSGATIENVTFNGYSTYTTDVDFIIDLMNENWTEGTAQNPGNSSYDYNNDSATGSWFGGNRSGTNPIVGACDYGSHDGWASCDMTDSLSDVQDGYDNWNWLNFRIFGAVSGVWNIGSVEAATPLWTVNITYIPAVVNVPPDITGLNCSNGTAYKTNFTYGETVETCQVRCTDADADTLYINLTGFKGISDFDSYDTSDDWFTLQNLTNSSGGMYTFTIPDGLQNESALSNITAICPDGTTQNQTNISWFIPWGTINISLITPTGDISVQNGSSFASQGQGLCNENECGNVTVYADPKTSNIVVVQNDGIVELLPGNLSEKLEPEIEKNIFERIFEWIKGIIKWLKNGK